MPGLLADARGEGAILAYRLPYKAIAPATDSVTDRRNSYRPATRSGRRRLRTGLPQHPYAAYFGYRDDYPAHRTVRPREFLRLLRHPHGVHGDRVSTGRIRAGADVRPTVRAITEIVRDVVDPDGKRSHSHVSEYGPCGAWAWRGSAATLGLAGVDRFGIQLDHCGQPKESSGSSTYRAPVNSASPPAA